MNMALIDKIADAVLYEGYILYPYRPSTKNRQRWTFGAVYPRAWCEHARSGDRAVVSTECLVVGSEATRLSVRLRSLHVIEREVRRLSEPLRTWTPDQPPAGESVPSLQVAGQVWHAWQEATEREVAIEPIGLADLAHCSSEQPFQFAGLQSVEPLRESDGQIVGLLVRRQVPLTGTIALSAECIAKNLWRIKVEATNNTVVADVAQWSRDEAALHSLASTHFVLAAEQGGFVSLTDPPEPLAAAAAQCRQEGLWPVLIGEQGATDAVLAAPIILYDYPQIAPESAGDLFDGTEIDEILSLRIMTLSDEEKCAVRAVDPRARALLERTESLDAAQLAALHGTVRELRPVQEAR